MNRPKDENVESSEDLAAYRARFQLRGPTPAERRDVLQQIYAEAFPEGWDLLRACRYLAKHHGKSVKEANDAYRAAMRSLGLSDAMPSRALRRVSDD